MSPFHEFSKNRSKYTEHKKGPKTGPTNSTGARTARNHQLYDRIRERQQAWIDIRPSVCLQGKTKLLDKPAAIGTALWECEVRVLSASTWRLRRR